MFKYTLHNPVCQYGFETIEIEATNAVDLQEQIVTALELLQGLNTRQVYRDGRLGDGIAPTSNVRPSGHMASPAAVGAVVADTLASAKPMPGTFTYKVPYQFKDWANPMLKANKARWDSNAKVWVSPFKIAELERYLTGPVVVRQVVDPLKQPFNYEE